LGIKNKKLRVGDLVNVTINVFQDGIYFKDQFGIVEGSGNDKDTYMILFPEHGKSFKFHRSSFYLIAQVDGEKISFMP